MAGSGQPASGSPTCITPNGPPAIRLGARSRPQKASQVRPGRLSPSVPVRPGALAQPTVTGTGADAIPLATTTRELAPAGVVGETVNLVDDEAPGAMDTEDQSKVLA